MLKDARQRQFDVVLVWAGARTARSVRYFLEVLDELNHLGIEFVSFRENIATGGPLGRVIIGAIAELERNLIIERVRAGMRRAKLEGRHIGRTPLDFDRAAVLRDRDRSMSLTEIAKAHCISRATVSRVLKEAQNGAFQPPSNSMKTGCRIWQPEVAMGWWPPHRC